MKKTKKYILIFLAVPVLSLLCYLVFCYPLVLNFSNANLTLKNERYKTGEVINPFRKFDFDSGSWTAYIFISYDDVKEISKEMRGGRSFKTSDERLLNEMKHDLKFTFTGGDMTTVESQLILCKNGKEVFESGIVLDDVNQGIQNQQYGWLEAKTKNLLLKYCKQFHKNYSPIIIIR